MPRGRRSRARLLPAMLTPAWGAEADHDLVERQVGMGGRVLVGIGVGAGIRTAMLTPALGGEWTMI